jgi:tRNA(Ile)-lysidine synthase
LRYTWFAELHRENKNVYVLLGHHANDNIETLLMNFFRGSGIEGLTGMHSSSYHSCLRPLLHNTRSQIEAFVKEHQLSWVEDSSNQESKYTRNFFRNELMPMLKKVYPSVEENLLDNVSRFKRIDALYKIGLEKIKKEVIEINGAEVVIPIHKLKPYYTTALIYEIIRDFGFGEKQVDEVLKLADSESGRYIENDSHQIIKHRKNLIITPKSSAPKTVAIIERNTETAELAGTWFNCRLYAIENFKLNKTETVAQLDGDVLAFPLLVRRWKEGDYFYPLGMKKKKKLSRFFIDQKLSRSEKEKVWVVESGQKIVWVVGYRIDDRFKITNRTKTVLEIAASTSQNG